RGAARERAVLRQEPRATMTDEPAPRRSRDGTREPFPVSAYFSVWQLRADGWGWLQDATGRCAEGPPQGEGPVGEIRELLDLLDPIERYWAFPGRQAFQHLRELLEDDEHEQLAKAVARINRALINDSRHPG